MFRILIFFFLVSSSVGFYLIQRFWFLHTLSSQLRYPSKSAVFQTYNFGSSLEYNLWIRHQSIVSSFECLIEEHRIHWSSLHPEASAGHMFSDAVLHMFCRKVRKPKLKCREHWTDLCFDSSVLIVSLGFVPLCWSGCGSWRNHRLGSCLCRIWGLWSSCSLGNCRCQTLRILRLSSWFLPAEFVFFCCNFVMELISCSFELIILLVCIVGSWNHLVSLLKWLILVKHEFFSSILISSYLLFHAMLLWVYLNSGLMMPTFSSLLFSFDFWMIQGRHE